MADVNLKCDCGAVTGIVQNVSPSSGSRVICCCSDCQAFARYLNREDDILDEFGGTDIYQCTPSQITIQQGHDKLQCMRLSKKGLLRWHTSCCNTPIGNTVKAGYAFIGLIHNFLHLGDDKASIDRSLGPVKAAIQTQHAKGSPTYKNQAAKFPPGITLAMVKNLLVWRLQGKHKPNPFFNDNGRPIVKPAIADSV